MTAVAEHMPQVILGSLGLTYLIALVLILARPARWRGLMWVSQLVGFSATCFVMDWIGLRRPLAESLMLGLGGAGAGALAAWRWDGVAEWVRNLARARIRRRRAAARRK